jgi:23S rRNA (guanosine2251-2'-O)-methyltransferase
MDLIGMVQVRNLAEGLVALQKRGYQTIGLDSEGANPLELALHGDRIALVLGAEGKGLRQKTRQTCGTLARIALPGSIQSLNVSNAAVLALYIAQGHLAAN